MSLENEIKKLREVIEINNKLLEQTLGQVACSTPDDGKCWSDKMDEDEKSLEPEVAPSNITHATLKALADELVIQGVEKSLIKSQVTKLGASRISLLADDKLEAMTTYLKTLKV